MILILLTVFTYYVSLAQVPAEEAALAARHAFASNSDMYISPDSTVWIFNVKHIRARKYIFTAECAIPEGYYLVANYQPSGPMGLILPPTFKVRQYTTYTMNEGDFKEKPRSSTWHKCLKWHKCETDNTLRIYKGVKYSKKLRIKKHENPRSLFIDGELTFREYSGDMTSTPRVCPFLLRIGQK